MLIPYAADLIKQYIPWYLIASETIKDFHFPHWIPGLYNFGYPLLAQGETGVLSPINFLILLIFPFPQSVNILYGVYFSFGIAGLYLFLRTNNLEKIPGILGALIFMLSGFFISRYFQTSIIFTAALLPWGFLIIQKSLMNSKLLLLMAVLVYLQITAGHLQIALISVFIYIVFSVFLTIRPKVRVIFNIKLLTIVILGFLLTSIQILPSLKLFELSQRKDWDPMIRFSYSLPPSHLLTYLSPNAYGISQPGDDYGFRQFGGGFWELNLTIWTVPFILSLTPAISLLQRMNIEKNKRKMLIILYLLWLVSILISFGGFFKPNVLIAHLPNFPFRAPARFLLISTFSAACLSAFGFSQFFKRKNKLMVIAFAIVLTSILFQLINQMNTYLIFKDKNYVINDSRANIHSNSLATPLRLDETKIKDYSSSDLEEIFRNEFKKGLGVSILAFAILLIWYKIEISRPKH